MKAYFASDLARLERNGVKVRIVGRREGLSADILAIVEEAEARTAANEPLPPAGRLQLRRPGRHRRRGAQVRRGSWPRAGRARTTSTSSCSSASFPLRRRAAPDLIIRTGYERRLSNFLLWECAYAELIFQDVYWPDYGPEHLRDAIVEFQSRERRFGRVAVDDVLAAG